MGIGTSVQRVLKEESRNVAQSPWYSNGYSMKSADFDECSLFSVIRKHADPANTVTITVQVAHENEPDSFIDTGLTLALTSTAAADVRAMLPSLKTKKDLSSIEAEGAFIRFKFALSAGTAIFGAHMVKKEQLQG